MAPVPRGLLFILTCRVFSICILTVFPLTLCYSLREAGGAALSSWSPVLRDALALNPQAGQSRCVTAAPGGLAAPFAGCPGLL